MAAFVGDSSKRGVYIITNRTDGAAYIGSTIKHFRGRWASHISELRRRVHGNIHLQRAYDRDGEDAFDCSVLEYVDDADHVLVREQYWLDHYRAADTYNMCPIAVSPAGRKMTEVQKARLSVILRAIKSQPHDRKRQSDAMRGRKVNTDETYQRLAQQRAKTYPGLIGPDGTTYHDITNMSAFAREHGLSAKKIHAVANGKKLSCLGWTAIGADRAQMLTTSFSFRDPHGIEYENITNLTSFCKQHDLLLSAMSQVHSRRISHHKGWQRIDGEQRRCFAFIAPDGTRYETILNLNAFCREHGLNKDAMSKVHTGKFPHYKGWIKGA